MVSDSLVVFDVREIEEFDVSHIQGAIQIDPDITSDEFEHEFSQMIIDKGCSFLLFRRTKILSESISIRKYSNRGEHKSVLQPYRGTFSMAQPVPSTGSR